ncbi:hypothetical protein A3N52_08065 [Klebsiella aerogenes]|nr:hypothetical protein A3N52_08065 [Klebsiella aerogenes]
MFVINLCLSVFAHSGPSVLLDCPLRARIRPLVVVSRMVFEQNDTAFKGVHFLYSNTRSEWGYWPTKERMYEIELCVFISRISPVNYIAAPTRRRGTILIIRVLSIGGNEIAKKSEMSYW